MDTFKVAVSSGGPFILHATLSNMLPGTDFDLDLIRDANNNGKVDSGEILASGTNAIGNEDVFADVSAGGTYYLQVRQISGEGPFTVGISSSNQDHAGNTLATATNIVNLFGRTQLADFVSSTDRLDIYKFTLPDPGTVTASFPETAANTDADLDLIQDANGNGSVDANEILASSVTIRTNAGESVSRAVAAGTYYVRVTQRVGSPLTRCAHRRYRRQHAGDGPQHGPVGDAADAAEFIGPGGGRL